MLWQSLLTTGEVVRFCFAVDCLFLAECINAGDPPRHAVACLLSVVQAECVCTGDQRRHAQLAHSAGSEWIAQQLQKAYCGLATTLTKSRETPTTAEAGEAEESVATEHANDAWCHEHELTTQPEASHNQSATSPDHPASTSESQTSLVPEIGGDESNSQGNHQQHQQQQPQQQHEQQSIQAAPQPPAPGEEETHACVKLDSCMSSQSQGVPDRVPAAVALQSRGDPNPSQHKIKPAESLGDPQAAADRQTQLDQPQLVKEQEQKPQKKSNPTPVFVPIVIAMDARDHKLLVEEWYSRQMVSTSHLHCVACMTHDGYKQQPCGCEQQA